MMTVLAAVLALAVGLAGGFLARKALVSWRMTTAEARAAKLMADAEMEAETKVRTSLDEVRQEISAMRKEAEQDIRLRRQEIKGLEDRLTKREESAEAKLDELQAREKNLEQAGRNAEELREELARTVGEQRRELERVSRLT